MEHGKVGEATDKDDDDGDGSAHQGLDEDAVKDASTDKKWRHKHKRECNLATWYCRGRVCHGEQARKWLW